MFRAFSFIEALVVLAVTVIAFYLIPPVIFRLHNTAALQNEVENIRAFLYQVQADARFHQHHYAVQIAQQGSQWCLIALAKKREKPTACNCLTVQACHLDVPYRLYRNYSDVILTTKRLYPDTFMHFDPKSGNPSNICLGLKADNQQVVLQIQRNGVINAIYGQTRSRCKETL